MNAIRATVKSGRLELDTPPEWPDGTEVLIEPTTDSRELVGMDESQWRDDPDSLADWNDWIKERDGNNFPSFREYDIKSLGRSITRRSAAWTPMNRESNG